MYCIKCGVELAESESVCPLCKTRVYHPDIQSDKSDKLYPEGKYPKIKAGSKLAQVLLSAAFLLPILIVLLCDLQFNRTITWSGYVVGALLVGYVTLALPTWFNNPNPVIFVPCDFIAVGLYLLYINEFTNGNWFLSFAFPVVGGIALIVVTVVTLLRYVKFGKFFIFGGATIAFGGFMLLLEFMMSLTFNGVRFIGWSLYPLVTFAVFGGLLIFLGINRNARETLERIFFI